QGVCKRLWSRGSLTGAMRHDGEAHPGARLACGDGREVATVENATVKNKTVKNDGEEQEGPWDRRSGTWRRRQVSPSPLSPAGSQVPPPSLRPPARGCNAPRRNWATAPTVRPVSW